MPNTPRTIFPLPEKHGYPDMVNLANPAVGTNWHWIPSNQWRISVRCITFTISCDGTVINRNVGVKLTNLAGALNAWRIQANAVGAGVVTTFQFYVNCPVAMANNYGNGQYHYPLLDTQITSLFKWHSEVLGLQAGDQLSDIFIDFYRWLDPEDN
jgi:hypothetical protein